MEDALVWAGLGALALPGLVMKAKRRLELSKGKHPSLAGHAKMSRRVAKLLPFYEYDEAEFFSSDDAPEDVAARRRAGRLCTPQHPSRPAGSRRS